MTFRQALKTGKPIRNKTFNFVMKSRDPFIGDSHLYPKAWVDPEFFLSTIFLTKEQILSNKWEVKHETKKRKTR